MDIIVVQIFLGIILFFIINWIGKHSYSIGYMEISIFVKTEEAPALNFLIRVLTPIVYITIVSALLYYLNFDKFVQNIYLVNIYYIIFRLLFNLITNRGLLLNWPRQFLYWMAIIVISFFTYDKIIKYKMNILPDFTTLSNELWIIILIFIFHITNNIRLSHEASEKRKDNYLKNRYNFFYNKYGDLIKSLTNNEILESIVYAVLIYEDFNRPKIARYIEEIRFRITKKPHTLGVMQVKSDKLISDTESVKLGTLKLITTYKQILESALQTNEQLYEYDVRQSIITDYNFDYNYYSEVDDLSEIIKKTFYNKTKDSLIPKGLQSTTEID